jgi:hypothetical protein
MGTGGPVQEIDHPTHCRLSRVDLSTSCGAAPLDLANSWLQEESRRPFRLTDEPPFRAALLRLDPEDHVLALTIHHIAFDGWSRRILHQELLQLYSAFAAGRPSPLAEPSLQYQDYAAWQRERMLDGDMVRSLDYWRGRLAGAPASLPLPTDPGGPASGAYLGRLVTGHLTENLVQGLLLLSRRERVTVFMTLLTGFVALLARVTGQADLVIGVPIAGRTRLELSGLIGCCTNTLVLRIDVSGDPTYRELLQRVRLVCLSGYTHQELPFEYLVRELQPERRLGQHPLFQVLFNYLDFPPEPFNPPGLEVEELAVPSETALVNLSVEIRRTRQALTCSFSCNAELFQLQTVEWMVQDYLAALELCVAEPDLRISALPASWHQRNLTTTGDLLQELEQMSDEEAERVLEAELRSGLK